MTDYRNTPVHPIESARAGWITHIGNGQFATRCPRCNEILTGPAWLSVQSHLWEVHRESVAMLP